ncbi:MAG TPA: 50S ribosomal protein L3 [Nitrospiria bacterium]|nr:50S ribosomal protein L3 [Nitrospiria bacterium]
MIQGMIGKKLGMTQVFTESGQVIPVSVVQAGPCRVVQLRTPEKNGYSAIQLSYQEVKEGKLSKPGAGHFRKAGTPPSRYLREFPGDLQDVQVGQVITADIFRKGEKVDVAGVSKGKGFAGVMKRHHFSGGPATHGSMFHRTPGSIGSSSYPSRVWKNQRMAGQMGNERVTVKNLEVVEVKVDQNLLLIRGAVPGSAGTLLIIKKVVNKK